MRVLPQGGKARRGDLPSRPYGRSGASPRSSFYIHFFFMLSPHMIWGETQPPCRKTERLADNDSGLGPTFDNKPDAPGNASGSLQMRPTAA